MKQKVYTAIFLSNKYPFKKLIVLKRADWKKFAPLMYTGIGGKVENGESVLEGALRELKEETEITGIEIIEFARVTFGHGLLHYFWGIYSKKNLPECNEGDLEWKEINEILNLSIIPSTKLVLEEWSNRGFSLDKPWTMWMSGKVDKVSGITLNPKINLLIEGLH